MKSWQPELITIVAFPNCKLTRFHVATLVNLKELDLSHNLITDLFGNGTTIFIMLIV